MADDGIPEELVTARRAFRAADDELARLVRLAPKPVIVNGVVVGADAELNARMNAVREELRRLAEFIAGYDWTGNNGVYAAWLRVERAAKAAA